MDLLGLIVYCSLVNPIETNVKGTITDWYYKNTATMFVVEFEGRDETIVVNENNCFYKEVVNE